MTSRTRSKDHKRNLLGKPWEILIVGAGSFGTALASTLVDPARRLTILAKTDKSLALLPKKNQVPSCLFSTFQEFHGDFSRYDAVILAVPCQSLRDVSVWMTSANTNLQGKIKLISTAKGVEQKTLLLPSQILEEIFGIQAVIGVLSGPSFAKEMLQGLPTSVVFASKSHAFKDQATDFLGSTYFHVYQTDDVIGTEVGGALKNVIALVAGAVDGLQLGANARASVITRGLAEIAHVGTKLGAQPTTFMGLSGLGDLLLSATGDLSRNRQFGFRLAQGEQKESILSSLGGVVEGITTAQSVRELCQKHQLHLPILDVCYRVLYENLPIHKAVLCLLGRHTKREFHWI